MPKDYSRKGGRGYGDWQKGGVESPIARVPSESNKLCTQACGTAVALNLETLAMSSSQGQMHTEKAVP